MWIGTGGGGLNLFDREKGSSVVFKHNKLDPKSLTNNDVREICKDSSGYLWVGTWGGGLDLMDPSKGSFKNFKYSKNHSRTKFEFIVR